MKINLLLLSAVSSLLILTACNRASNSYTVDNFDELSVAHRTIAILPYEVIITGRMPKDMTIEQKEELESIESVAFQQSLASQLFRRSNSYKVNFIAVDKVNSALEENNISIRESWKKDPQKLAELLGVDAVVRGKVSQEQYLTHWESYGVSMAQRAIFASTGSWYPLGNISKTSDVDVELSIVDKDNGYMLFNIAKDCPANWNSPAEEVVDKINYKVSKYFPYKR